MAVKERGKVLGREILTHESLIRKLWLLDDYLLRVDRKQLSRRASSVFLRLGLSRADQEIYFRMMEIIRTSGETGSMDELKIERGEKLEVPAVAISLARGDHRPMIISQGDRAISAGLVVFSLPGWVVATDERKLKRVVKLGRFGKDGLLEFVGAGEKTAERIFLDWITGLLGGGRGRRTAVRYIDSGSFLVEVERGEDESGSKFFHYFFDIGEGYWGWRSDLDERVFLENEVREPGRGRAVRGWPELVGI